MENKFDKEVEDLGWEKMQALLDKEKPVVGIVPPQYIDQKLAINGSSRKRWALMALLFLSLVGCGIGSYYFFKIKPKNQPAIALNNAVSIEKNSQNLTQNNTPEIANDTKKIIENEVHGKGKNNNLTKWSNSKNDNLSKKNKPHNFIDEKLTNGSNALNTVILDDKTQNNEEKFVEKNASENADKIGDRLTFAPLNQLFFEPINDTVSSIAERHNPIINLKENAPKMLQKWQFGLTLGAHTEGVSSLDGYQIGLILNKNLTRKWAFSTGLNYRKSSTKSRENASFLAADKANNSAGVTTPSSSFNLSKVVEVRLKDMQYLELPVMFDHLVNNRLSVFGGLKMSYLLSKNWVNIDSTNANLYVNTYSNQSNKASSSSSNSYDKLSSNLVNNSLDFAILGGINYRISRHFDVSVRYDFGLKNILKQNNASVYNRYLGLNVNYYFN